MLNWYFNKPSAWFALPRGYNLQPALWVAANKAGFLAPQGPANVAIVHFVGRDKPWDARARYSQALPEQLVGLWRAQCHGLMQNLSL